MAYIFLLLFLPVFCGESRASSIAEFDYASKILSPWFIKTTTHFDFESATPLGRLRFPGFAKAQPFPIRSSHAFGVSYMQVPIGTKVQDAYRVLGANTNEMPEKFQLTRFHFLLAISDWADIGASYLLNNDRSLKGWGVSLKPILYSNHPQYISPRFFYSQTTYANFFTSTNRGIDLTYSLNFNIIDFYIGTRFTQGEITFNGSDDSIPFGKQKYQSSFNTLEYFAGTVLAISRTIRLTFQGGKIEEDYMIAGKFSFKIPSIVPLLRDSDPPLHY